MRKTSPYCSIDSVVVPFEQTSHVESDPEVHKSSLPFPVFNEDKRYYTPAWVVGQDLDTYSSFPLQDFEKFDMKVQEALERSSGCSSQIFVPKPISTKCQVCNKEYDDYQSHIQEEPHLKLFRSSLGQYYANELIKEFVPKKSPKI